MSKSTVLIVDDHSIVRMGLVSLLNSTNDFTVIGEANDGEAAIRQARVLKPDIIIMDLMMPHMDGAEATAAILRDQPSCKILILTTFGSFNGVAKALKAGASGALLKNIDNDTLIDALERISKSERVIAPEITMTLRTDPPVSDLSRRQREFLELLSKGLTNCEIAEKLGLQEDSVKKLANQTFAKIGADNRADAVAITLRKHLIDERP